LPKLSDPLNSTYGSIFFDFAIMRQEIVTMASRNACLLVLVQVMLASMSSAPALGGENNPGQWNKIGAAQFLDNRGEAWFNFGSAHRGQKETKSTCVSCHSLLPYALARPTLRRISDDSPPTKLETKILEQTKSRVANWDRLDAAELQLMYDFDDDKKKQSRGTEAILNALILSFDDRFQGRKEPSDSTKNAVSILWATQIDQGPHKGSWEWINFGMEPWESNGSPYFGASLAAVAVGTVQGNGLNNTEGDSKQRLGALRNYLTTNFAAQNLHNRVWMLWASSSLDGLLTPAQKDQLIDQILAKQQASGGWTLGSLGDFTHGEVKTAATTPDGYSTGLILHVLQVAGLTKENPQVSKGLTWLRSNQDPSGAWRAMSVNKIRSPESPKPALAHIGKFMWDAATGYAVLALSHE
jgi:squalene-hopene/tetraprenyl-beta-curcumene cyclase